MNRNKSGRVWKSVSTKKTFKKSVVSWNERKEIELKEKISKELELELVNERIAEKRAKKQVLIERQKRKLENEKQAEITQKISAAKLRRMKKKQLRNLQKQ